MHFIIYITVYAAMVACIDIRGRWIEREHLTPPHSLGRSTTAAVVCLWLMFLLS